jgi:hypothetical protein
VFQYETYGSGSKTVGLWFSTRNFAVASINANDTLGCASKILAIRSPVEFCCCTRRCSVFMPRMIKYAAFCGEEEVQIINLGLNLHEISDR